MSKGNKKSKNPEEQKQIDDCFMFEVKVKATEIKLAYKTEACETSNMSQQDLQREIANLTEELDKRDKALV